MPHIHTQPGQNDHTASAFIVLRLPGEEPKMLLHMHKKLGVLLQFGGHVELNETVWQAVAHEVMEEVGYSLNELSVLQPTPRITAIPRSIVHPQPVILNAHNFRQLEGHCHLDTAFLMQATDWPKAKPGEGESADIRALSRQEIETLSEQEIYADTKAMALAILEDFVDVWEPVPATEYSLEQPQY